MNRGLFKCLVMFFGLTNSPAIFQTVIDALFDDLVATGNVIIYMDDILIVTDSNNIEDHIKIVSIVLKHLEDNDLFLKPEKCHFHKHKVEYLGIIIGNGQVKMDPIKVKGITDWPIPTTVSELCSFLSFGNYYKDFIQDYSRIACPLHDLTKKTHAWKWEDDQQTAFDTLKHKFTSYPVLRNPDPTKCYIVDANASAYAIRVTVSQDFSDRCHPHHLL